jgi:hypothetical protein
MNNLPRRPIATLLKGRQAQSLLPAIMLGTGTTAAFSRQFPKEEDP